MAEQTLTIPPFEALTLEALRTRTSIKWRMYPPDVLPLWVAEMDAPPVPAVVDTLHDALRRGDLGYPAQDSSYAEAFAACAARRWDWVVDVDDTRTVADVLTGVHHAIAALSAPGDAVLVPAPVYPPLLGFTAEAGRRVVTVPLTEAGRLDLGALDAAMAEERPRVLLLCSPHNPTGTVHSADELHGVAALAERHGVDVVVDEIHALLVPEPARFTPYLSVADRGVVVTSASKAYNLAGLKAALIVAGPGNREVLDRLPAWLPYGVSHVGAMSHVAAWRDGDAWLDAVNANIAANARYLGELLGEHLPGVGYRVPEATYLAWLDCSSLGLGDDPASAMLERGRVALNSGLTFGPGGEGHVRVNLAASRATLAEAVARMSRIVRG